MEDKKRAQGGSMTVFSGSKRVMNVDKEKRFEPMPGFSQRLSGLDSGSLLLQFDIINRNVSHGK